MPEKKLQLRILTSETVKVDEPVDMVIMRCITEEMGKKSAVGDMGILPGHAPCSAVLGINVFRIINDGEERILSVYGGVVSVLNNVVTVLTEKARWPEDIKREEAEAELREAEMRLTGELNDVELRSNQINLRRALVDIEVSSYPLISPRR